MSLAKPDGVVEKLPDSVWLHHRDTLYQLFIAGNKPLSVVKRTMEDEHGFLPQRLCDYEVALREVLHFRKNIKRGEWRTIGFHISERKRQGKESEVIWNNTRFEAKKIRKEIQRNNRPKPGLARKVNPDLPQGLVIRTPPRSPAAGAAVLLPSLEAQLAYPPAISTQAVSEGSEYPANSSSAAYETLWEVQRELFETGELGVSPYRRLRENLPFNRCMSQIMDLAQPHQLHLCVPSAEAWTPVSPRLFGANPSWELFARQIDRLSNKRFYSLDPENQWFLKWVGISADFELLKVFFSTKSPTAGAVYEELLFNASNLRMKDLVRVLFELRHFLFPNNRTSFNAADFIRAAVQIGSRTGDCLDILNTCLSNKPPPSMMNSNDLRVLTNSSVLTAADRGDVAMLRVLVNVGWKVEPWPDGFSRDDFMHRIDGDDFVSRLNRGKFIGRLMDRIYSWDLRKLEDLTVYIDLLFRGGVLDGTASSLCSNNEHPRVVAATHTISSITWDELVMICPPMMRQTLQGAFMGLRGCEETGIRRAGVFTVAQDGTTGLRAHIEAHREDDAFQTRVTLEECLLFAAAVNDSKAVLALLEFGVDPHVGLLSNNLRRYRRGNLSCNPSIVAAAAGHLEVLSLLLGRTDLLAFLDVVPIHEMVRHGMLSEFDLDDVPGEKLTRLSNLHRSYLNARIQSSKLAAEGNLSERELQDTFLGTGKVFELLEYIRSIAHSHGYGQKVDLDIIKAAVSRAVFRRRIPWLSRWKQCLPCDLLLMRGLIDPHLDYKAQGMDLLHLSIRNHCRFQVVRFLSDKGFEVHSKPNGQNRNTMLHDALLSNSPDRSEIVEFLLRNGADCKFRGDGLSILEAAVSTATSKVFRDENSEDLRIFERLLDAGATACNWPRHRLPKIPLISMLLTMQASNEMILRVIDTGLPIKDCDYGHRELYYRTGNFGPLQAAILDRREGLARELIRRGADVHAPASLRGFTALQAACIHNLPVPFLEYLVCTLGVDVNRPPEQGCGYSSLAAAVTNSSLAAVEFLLNHGADINAMCKVKAFFNHDSTLCRPVDLAVREGRLDMVNFLLKAGGRSSKSGLGGAIAIAAERGHYAILSLLRSWNDKHGRRILENEALWQGQNPEQALMLTTEPPYGPPARYCESNISGDDEDDEYEDDSDDLLD